MYVRYVVMHKVILKCIKKIINHCVDNEILQAAQRNPEEHRDLIVRVAGYSAFFVELCKEVQDEIISRTVIQ